VFCKTFRKFLRLFLCLRRIVLGLSRHYFPQRIA
jgi:hypothetical protein